MFTVDEIIDSHGETISNLGYGRRQLCEWLNQNVEGQYTEHFARRVLDELSQQTERVTPPVSGKSMEDILRDTYGLYDPTWVPVSVWGDPRNPRAKWERRLDLVDEERIQKIVKNLGGKELPNVATAKGERMAVLSIRDTHFGMFTEHPGPYESYDLREAQNAYLSAASELMIEADNAKAGTLVIPFGSDALHVDGPQSTTTRGTPQEISTAWWRAFEAALQSISIVVEAAAQKFDVVLVLEPGNHDHSLAQALGIAVASKYQKQARVTVLAGHETLKKVSIGNCHVFMHHGDTMKPQNYQGIIYGDHPECATHGAYVEVLTGHLHHRRRGVLLDGGDYLEENGIVHRITPALCPASNWSESQGYRSRPGAQLTVYTERGFHSLYEWRPSSSA